MKIFTTIAALVFLTITSYAQKDVKLNIKHMLGAQTFAFNQESQNDLGHKIKLQRLEYYISGISIVHDGGKVADASDVYILVKANSNETFQLGNFDITTIEAINFSIGVDKSVNNEDPSQWPSEHALAPKFPSMHWGWASGFRFVALEGKSGRGFTQDFQIHALGNENYFPQNIPVTGKDVDGALIIELNADYNEAVKGMNMDAGLFEHSVSGEAARCLRLFHKSVFTSETGQGNTLKVKTAKKESLARVFPNPSQGSFYVGVNPSSLDDAQLEIVDALGRSVEVLELTTDLNEIYIEKSGIYFLKITRNGATQTERIVVQ